MSPVLGRPPRAPRSRPVNPGARAPGVGKGTTASIKPTGAPRATDRRRRGAARGAKRHAKEARRQPQPRHTDRCKATTAPRCRKPGQRAPQPHNHGTGGDAKQHPTTRGAPIKTHQRRPSAETEAWKRLRSNSEEETRPSSTRETERPGLDRPGRTKKQEPPPPGLEHPGTRGRGCPGLELLGQNKQQEPR